MNKLAVLGIGNTLMMDDGIGVYIVERLKKENKDEEICFFSCETDLSYALEIAENYEKIYLVDACIIKGKNVGDVTIFPIEQINYMDKGISQHDLHLFHYLKTKIVNGLVISIQVHLIDIHYGLSEELKDKFPTILKAVRKIVYM